MTEELQIDECFNCKKKKDISDNWRTCKLKCSYKYKRKENDYITRLEQENKEEKKAYNECIHYLACMTEQRNKLKIALEETREIAMGIMDDDIDEGSAYYDADQIINKINEVLNDI